MKKTFANSTSNIPSNLFYEDIEYFAILANAAEDYIRIGERFCRLRKLDITPDYVGLNNFIAVAATSAVNDIYETAQRMASLVQAVEGAGLGFDLGLTDDDLGEAYEAAKQAIRLRHMQLLLTIEQFGGIQHASEDGDTV